MTTTLTHSLAPTLRVGRVWPLVGWTVFVWGSRIRNIWADDELEPAGQVGRTALAVSLLIPGLMVAWLLLSRRGSPVGDRTETIVFGLAAWTVAVWVVRSTQILIADHDANFKVVHTGLAVVSIGLAALAAGRLPARSR